MDQGHNSNQGDVQGRERAVGQGIAEPMEEINEVAPMEGITGDATVEVNGAAAVNVVNGAGVNCKFSHAYLPELSFVYVCLMIYLSVLLICVLSSVHMLICLYGLSSVHIFISSMCIFNTFLPFIEQPAVPKNPSLNARADAYKAHLKTKETTTVPQNDLERYLSDPPENDDPSFNILTWWKKNCVRYPVLATMVRDVLATPVSSVASESAFSTEGRILDTYRSSLSPEMAEALICTQNWLKPSIIDFKDLNLSEEYELLESVVAEIGQVLNGVVVGPGGPAAGVAPATGL